mmetsp:Transcript_94347/g.149196  ORF Transcript_94347/g.149196 Transcript_94347/m.149196 type:complete len:227 (+) Transcript_94347:74-754(+)
MDFVDDGVELDHWKEEEEEESGNSPDELLMRAARVGMPAEVRALIEFEGANVNYQSKRLTPLMLACFADGHTPVTSDQSGRVRLKVAETLLEHQADIHAEGPGGWTPLFFSCFYAVHDISILLLKNGANACKLDQTGRDCTSWLRWSEPDREKQKPVLKLMYQKGVRQPVIQLVKQGKLENQIFCPLILDRRTQETLSKNPDVMKKPLIALAKKNKERERDKQLSK